MLPDLDKSLKKFSSLQRENGPLFVRNVLSYIANNEMYILVGWRTNKDFSEVADETWSKTLIVQVCAVSKNGLSAILNTQGKAKTEMLSVHLFENVFENQNIQIWQNICLLGIERCETLTLQLIEFISINCKVRGNRTFVFNVKINVFKA